MNMIPRIAPPPRLADDTLADLRVSFAVYGHAPSEALWAGIEDVVVTLAAMADGTLKPLPYLTRLDPGVGKTETAVHFVRNLLKSPDRREVAVLYCVSRLKDIPGLVDDIGKENVAVLTRDDEMNNLGKEDPFWARVLITTQQMVEKNLSGGGNFADIEKLQYRAKPRQVRIWDEAMMPGEELTIDLFRLAAMSEFLRNLSLPLATRIQEVCEEIAKLPSGSTHEFLDPKTFGVDEFRYRAVIANLEKRFREAGETIWKLAGKTVRVRHDPKGNMLLDYRDHLPEDFFPVVILDASGRVRTTYEYWEECRKGLVRLKEAGKKYSNLTAHVWLKAGGKSAWRQDSTPLIEGIASTINRKPDQRWLVVIHKEDDWLDQGQKRIPDIGAHIRDQTHNPKNVSFLTWGEHKATNEFIECTNVILAGTLFYPKSVYEVRTRASMGLPAKEALDDKALARLIQGEHKDLILQAACRGSVRKCRDGADCGPMNLYVIAAPSTGIPATLGEVFPGCRVLDWFPQDRPLTNLMKRALKVLDERIPNPGDSVKILDVSRGVGCRSKANFNRIRKERAFKDALADGNFMEVSMNGSNRLTHFRKEGSLE